MSDETNDLLRQILKAQQESLAAYKEESKKAADFRIYAVGMQKTTQRRIVVFLVVMGALIIISMVFANLQPHP